MELKLSGLKVNIKGERGLAFQHLAYASRKNTFPVASILDASKGYVTLKPGEETEVLIPLSNVPVNANVKTIRATLHVEEDTSSVMPEKITVGIQKNTGVKETYHLETETPGRPRNVELKLDQGEIFWTFSGALTKPRYDLPDFSEQVNVYMDKVQPDNDRIILRFLIKSDTRGKVKIEIDKDSLEYSLIQTQTWGNPLDNTIRLDRNFQLDYDMIEKVSLDPISHPISQKISLKKIKMDIGGEFPRERLLGNVEEHNGKEFATISSDYSLAQRFILEISVQVTGVIGFFQAGEGEAELYIEIQNDTNGLPAVGSPLAKSNLYISPLVGENTKKHWTFSSFENPVDLNANVPYWIVIKGIRGKVQLGLQTRREEYLQQVLVNRGGQLWKSLGHASDPVIMTLLRLVYLPQIDNQTAAVEIGIEGTQLLQRLDPGLEAKTVSFDVESPDIKQTVIVIKSHAQGNLNIANVIQEYTSF